LKGVREEVQVVNNPTQAFKSSKASSKTNFPRNPEKSLATIPKIHPTKSIPPQARYRFPLLS
jgi:hypothetical protein